MSSTKRGRKPKYLHTIVLDGINAREIYKTYKHTRKNLPSEQSYVPIIEYPKTSNSDANVTDLLSNRKTIQPYLEPADSNRVTMIDYVKYGCLPERTDLWCGHCRHPFNTSPIGIPIRYISKKADKKQPEDDKTVGLNDYFLTFGTFCSFPCCLAFIKEHSHQQLFRDSTSLLYSLYYKLYGSELKVKRAPSWECLKVHGGHLTIEEFRKSFCNSNYIITENIKRPYMVAVGKYIEERRCGYI